MKQFALVVALVLVAVACGEDGGGDSPELSNVRVAQPTGPNAAMYFVAEGAEADRLIGASTDAATSVHIHETVVGEDGTMGMQPVDGLDLPAGGELILEPGSLHLMLIEAERMDVGDSVSVTLTWENAGDITVNAEVVAPGDAMTDMGDG